MLPDINWSLFSVELGMIALSLFCLILDIFIKNSKERGKVLANTAMAGISALFAFHCTRWGHFGSTFNGSFVQDGVSFYFKALFLLAGFFAVFMSREYQNQLKRGQGEMILLILFSQIGMLFLASAADFLLFFVGLETLTISLYIMTAYLRDKESSIEAGVKYLILGALSTAVFLFGLSFVYGATGSTSYNDIFLKISNLSALPAPYAFGMILIIASLGFKISAFPFQMWAPDVYEGAPSSVTAYLAIGSKAAGFAALVRLLLSAFAPAQAFLVPVFSALAALTIIYGNLGAIPQTNIKRLLAYSSIGHAGYLLIGLATFSQTGNEALLHYLLAYLFSTAGAFLVIIAISNYVQSDEISELAGLSKKSPLLAAGMFLSLLSLAGVPPLAGFFAKFYLLWSSVKSGLLWLTFIGVLNVITSLYYYLKVVKVIYLDKPRDEKPYIISFEQKTMQYFCILGILVLGIFQGPFVELAHRAFSNLVK